MAVVWVADVAWIPELLWLWCRLAATALIRPLAWEPPYASGAAQRNSKKTKKKKPKNKNFHLGVPVVTQWLTNPTRNHEVAGSIPGLAQWVKDLALLWLWHSLVATASIRPLAWEPPYAAGVALEKR